VYCRKRPVKCTISATYQHLQAQPDMMTSSEPVYELEVAVASAHPVLLTAAAAAAADDDDDEEDDDDGKHLSDDNSVNVMTSPIYSNVIDRHHHHHHHHQQQQQQRECDVEPVYREAEPCDELAYQSAVACKPRPPATPSCL